jgi:hypothetical protein
VSVHSPSGLFCVTGPIDKDCLCFTHSFLPQEANTANPMKLNWPGEKVNRVQLESAAWFQPHSNYCLDFHGDPHQSELAVYSDGNHHMALEQSLEAFRASHDLHSIFYCTTPPGVYLQQMRKGFIDLGNLRISRRPDVIIGPKEILQSLVKSGQVVSTQEFAKSVGNSLLVARHNPKEINQVDDLFRDDIRLFISNPVTEKSSYEIYSRSISNLATSHGIDAKQVGYLFSTENPSLILGEKIHHREAPEAIAGNRADVTIVYHHLALRYTRIFPDIFELVELPPGPDNLTTEYHAGVCEPGNSLAANLVDHLASKQTKSIYESHGLTGI